MAIYPTLFRRAVFPLLDRLNGTDVAGVLAGLERSQWLPREELEVQQRRKLRDMIEWTRRESSFYRTLWDAASDVRRARSALPELDGLPVISKADLRDRIGEFPVPGYRGRVLRIQTSGSTGVPATFLRSIEQEAWFWALRLRMWQWAGWEPGEPYVAINLNRRVAWKKRVQDVLFRCSYLTYNAATVDAERILEAARRSRATHVNGFSSSLLALAQYMEARGIGNPGVRAITTTGDSLAPHYRDLITRVFGVRPADYYGAGGEGVHLASQCPEQDGYHLHLENAVTEILVDGRPARPGETGSIVITQLDNRAMPLIRYDLGDLATAADGRACACGRSLPIGIESIGGRACDVVSVPGGGVLLPQFFFIGAFKLLERVKGYQVVQDAPDRITVRLVEEPGCDRHACERAVTDEIVRATRGALDVDVAWVEQLELSGLGKVRPVISRIEAPVSPPRAAEVRR
jgi:phenylacetate-CoA ligase